MPTGYLWQYTALNIIYFSLWGKYAMVWPKNVFSLQFVMLIVCVSKLSRWWSKTRNKPRACVSWRSILSLHLMQNWRRWGVQCEHRTVFHVETELSPGCGCLEKQRMWRMTKCKLKKRAQWIPNMHFQRVAFVWGVVQINFAFDELTRYR